MTEGLTVEIQLPEPRHPPEGLFACPDEVALVPSAQEPGPPVLESNLQKRSNEQEAQQEYRDRGIAAR